MSIEEDIIFVINEVWEIMKRAKADTIQVGLSVEGVILWKHGIKVGKADSWNKLKVGLLNVANVAA